MVPMIKEYTNFVPLNCSMHLNSQVSSGGPTGRRGRPVPPRAGRAHSQEIECVKIRRPLPWTTAARETHSNIEHVQITHVSGIFWHLMTTLTSQKTKHNNFANTCVVLASAKFNVRSLTGTTGWTEWSAWSSCTTWCGTGTQSRTRTCQNPLASLLTNSCDGGPLEYRTCTDSSCEYMV